MEHLIIKKIKLEADLGYFKFSLTEIKDEITEEYKGFSVTFKPELSKIDSEFVILAFIVIKKKKMKVKVY